MYALIARLQIARTGTQLKFIIGLDRTAKASRLSEQEQPAYLLGKNFKRDIMAG